MYDSILDRRTAAAEIKFPAREPVSSKVPSTILLRSISLVDCGETLRWSRESSETAVKVASMSLTLPPFLSYQLEDEGAFFISFHLAVDEDEEESGYYLESKPFAFRANPFAD